MAAIYTTGTINQPDAGSVGLSMVEKIRDDVSAHANWDLVEEFTPASGTVRWYVLKCLGSGNGLGSDFFVVIGRTLSTGELRFAICETYTAASHMMQKFGSRSINTPSLMDASGRLPDAAQFVLGTTPFAGGSSVPDYFSWVPSGTSTKWWIIVADDTMTISFNGGSNGFIHAGAYTWLGQLANPFPIQLIGSSNNAGLITRNPSVAGVNLTNYGYALKFTGGGTSMLGVPLGFEGLWAYNDKAQNNQRAVAEVGMMTISFPGQSDYATVYGLCLGKQKRIRRSNQSMPGGFAYGDAFAMNGTLWVPWNPSVGVIFDTGVASS